MTTPTSLATPAQPVIDHEAQWFAVHWLRGSRHLAVRTAPVIAVVQEMATVLRDEQVPASQALLALRRAVRLLGVLTAGTRDDDRRESDHLDGYGRVPEPDEVTGSIGSVRFAAEWLRGDPAEAIRAEPVIAVVEDLLHSMLNVNARPSEVYTALYRATRLLSVFTREDNAATTIHPAG
jgi:hypothetical protein